MTRKLTVLVLAAALTACGGPSGTAGPAAPQAAGYTPAEIKDCTGRTVKFSTPPKRVVALTDSVLEPLFWLGVQSTVVGIGSPPKPGVFPPQFDAAAQALPKLAGAYTPGAYKPVPREQLLAAQPDLVLGGFSSNFEAQGATSQQELADAGVNSYLALSTACAAATPAARTDLELIYQDLRNLGTAFGVADRANALIEEMRGKVANVGTAIAGAPRPKVFPFEFDEGTQTPYAPGNRQAVNAVVNLAGGQSIFADLDKAYQKLSWEQIAQDGPEVVLLIIYDKGNQAANDAAFAEAEKFVRGFPGLAGTPAVRDGRFARLVYEQASHGGVRSADAVVSLARQLHPDRVR
ncbi:ABC transporter substrate-binding protein [Amycolatopsis suaedae]|uniref:ABC transporter substrate-binding protein n=1 Tax=Amycolatopsis suaedae TaxID=2510978 RepID=UPI0013EF1D5F|nr:ABC transporter substrate-binding protein [Amycolatopsis suaedae]